MPWRRIAYPRTSADWIASAALLPLSWAYGLGWRSYEAVYRLGLKRRRQFPIPIIGVGNLTTGGEGKTPVVIELTRIAQSCGIQPAVSMSAYGSPAAAGVSVVMPDDPLDPSTHGDEPAEFRASHPSVPLILGRDRVAAAEAAVARNFACLFLDDGFQHLPLARTADLIIWNESLANKRLLPAGPMREPLAGIRRASAIVTYTDRPNGWEGLTFGAFRESVGFRDIASGATFPLEWISGREVDVLCAIARPEQFGETVVKLGGTVRTARIFPDHDALGGIEFGELPTIVTEKDATKLTAPAGRVYALAMRARFMDEEAVSAWLMKQLYP